MIPTVFPIRLGLALAGGALLLLSACAEQELILPGEREAIRGQIDGTRLEPTPDEIDNVSRPIRLPSAQRSASWAQAPGMPSHRVDNAALTVAPQLVSRKASNRVWSKVSRKADSKRDRDCSGVFSLESSVRTHPGRRRSTSSIQRRWKLL